MYNIQVYNSIAERGLAVLNDTNYTVGSVENVDAILLRSYNLQDETISSSVKAIARAGVGVNNIPVEALTERGVIVFNTPGANANAVKELVLMSLIASSRNLFRAVTWTNTLQGEGETVPQQVEAGKKEFVGTEIQGKRLGVIGVGAIGVLVANDATALGMEVVAYDPFISVNTAWQLSRDVQRAHSPEEIFQTCDYITMHVPLTEQTKEMLNTKAFQQMKPGMKVLNFSRGELVHERDLKQAIEENIVSSYITDFPNDDLLGMKNVVAIPHLGASTHESEVNCAIMAANQLKQFLETGNIQNSVNFPNVYMPVTGRKRLTVVHQNIPNMVGQITSLLANHSINIADMMNRSKGQWAYTLIDLDQDVDHKEKLIKQVMEISGVRHVRII
ncbi:D-3-phosphoglycerate dehydrogenase [Bacillus mesophilus]|uniref:D-3-phosphoglycerate dehydrogenase n=1 Tax=Bacillus mesophilus TaxID=1808955 RepID=A0A6M0Q9Y2_9BACI|nr:phosphoglycerate dehydrogenase [Bacillus mesophilus]MBM7662108.1 D-3-phosphoglycerate dehydrogenase [Bacillus mesophilus]NEY72539.1 phosphoglycerate dehydrogenase [Bacillus mesophilus]